MHNPILIAGPPRSGSTLVAGLFIKHGVWIGSANPTSYAETNSMIGTENMAIKNLHKEYRREHGYRNWEVPLPPQPHEVPELFRERVLELVDTEGPWLVKTAWLVIYWSLWAKAFPDARWVLLRRDADMSTESALRHPVMRKRGRHRIYNFMCAIRKRQQEIPVNVKHSFILPVDELVKGDDDVFDALFRFAGIEPDKNIADEFISRDRWHFAY